MPVAVAVTVPSRVITCVIVKQWHMALWFQVAKHRGMRDDGLMSLSWKFAAAFRTEVFSEPHVSAAREDINIKALLYRQRRSALCYCC